MPEFIAPQDGRNVGALIGILYTSVAVGTLIGPSVAGFAFDATRSYTVPILASAGANLLAAAVLAATQGRGAKAPQFTSGGQA